MILLDDAKYDFYPIVEEAHALFEKMGIDKDKIPLIAAGGIHEHAQIETLINAGFARVQIGIPFAVTQEGDANINFKKVSVNALPKDIVTFISAAGLPARAVLTPWLERYLKKESLLRGRADAERAKCPRNLECLKHCGFKDGNPEAGQFCIETQLAAAQRADVKRGLFFRGTEPLPFGKAIMPVHDLLRYLLKGSPLLTRVLST